MSRKNRKPLDAPAVGFFAGFFLPVVVFFAVYWFGESDISFENYVKNLWHLHALVKLGSLCVFANLVVFMAFIRLKYDQAARGVLGATIIYALAVLISRAF
ncbi:hypothetical protein SAMN05444274_10385 [Mariniphaga anaerophila]|uniref:Uncharacterized protein n=1 Tax=Mariniphaga anaerophila TaxID=1484053 RepID=A0A1M4XQL3_9BACT|nr:hypothetical protein [Mariniphaga anaerophila]SHE95745.1 hypothetical protein SAMN05444274_10385 [Mariniphaga anaerophila]